MLVFTSSLFYFFWKPAGCASSRGKKQSFLQLLETVAGQGKQLKAWPKNSISLEEHFNSLGGEVLQRLFLDQLAQQHISLRNEHQEVLGVLLEQFTAVQEYGLLNRLDTATSGLLYFAKTREVYEQFPEWQHGGCIRKRYLARVRGDPLRNLSKRDTPFFEQQDERNFSLSFPLMHHAADDEKMLAFGDPDQQTAHAHRGRGKVHTPTTAVELVAYDAEKNESIVLVTITKGVRHQIRVHLATLGNPIVGDTLYNKQHTELPLQLISCGAEIVKNVG